MNERLRQYINLVALQVDQIEEYINKSSSEPSDHCLPEWQRGINERQAQINDLWDSFTDQDKETLMKLNPQTS